MLRSFTNYMKHDLWSVQSRHEPPLKRLGIRILRVLHLTVRGFHEDKCVLRASALGFYSLLSIVPVMAMIFGIASGFGFERMLTSLLIEKFQGQEDLVMQVIQSSRSLLENTKEELIAGVGVVILFWVVIRVLGHIEKSFNVIWGTKRSRTIGQKIIDYFFIVLIFPMLFIMSSSITVLLTSRIEYLFESVKFLGTVSPLILPGLKILPYAVIWILFVFLYIFMPNTKVRLYPGIIAGIAAGTMFQIVQYVYIKLQITIANYNAIYGSFAALPFLLIWLQISWSIVLIGAEISFAIQNADQYENNLECLELSYSRKKEIIVEVMHLIVKRFQEAAPPMTSEQIAQALSLPLRLIQQSCLRLLEAQLISEVNDKNSKNITYQPSKKIDTYTITSVIDSIEHQGCDNDIDLSDHKSSRIIIDSMRKLNQSQMKSRANLRLKDIPIS